VIDVLSKSIWIDAPPEIVFPYFVEADKLARWTGENAEVNPVPGGFYRLDMGNAGVITAQIVTIEPPRFLSYQVVSHGRKLSSRSTSRQRPAAAACGCRTQGW
jgi:uncharacterized protein YndB with AHSA1/START domain